MNPTQTAKFRFGPVRQEVGAKHVRQGDLLEAINVRQTAKAGVYAKRKAFKRTAQTFSGGSLSGTPETVLPGIGGNTLMRDTGDQLWARNAGSNSWMYMGKHARPWLESTTVQSNLYTKPQPFSCIVGSSLWAFALTTDAYEFSIVNISDGLVTTPKTTVAATGIVHASASYDGTYVWIFWVDNGANGTIRCHRITATTPTVAPVATTYYTIPNSPAGISTVKLQQVQSKYLSSPACVVVVACGGSFASPSYKRAVTNSVLDPATGLAKAGANVQLAYVGVNGLNQVDGLAILEGEDGSSGTWRYCYAEHNTSIGYARYRVKVDVSFPTAVVSTQYDVTTGASYRTSITVAGFHNTADDADYMVTTKRTESTYTGPGLINVTTVDRMSSVGVFSTAYPSAILTSWIASSFFRQGAYWYFLTGMDDYDSYRWTMPESQSLQRMVHLRRFDVASIAPDCRAPIIGQLLAGNFSAAWHAGSAALAFSTSVQPVPCVGTAGASGTTAIAAIAVAGESVGYVDLAVLRIDFAKVHGKSVQAMGRGFSPGNIPITWSQSIVPHEIAPLGFPVFLTASGGTVAGWTIAAAVFAIYDNDGTVWRSAPKVVSGTFNEGTSLSVSVPLYLDTTNMYVEFYLGTNGTPKLQGVVKAPTTFTSSVSFVAPTVATMIDGEILYTTGNALSNSWPVPCQAIGTWGNRIFAAQKNVLWASKELEQGFGPLFNEVQTSPWNEERGDITALSAVDWNYLGIASADQVAVISGPGPDGVGNGNFVIKTLPSYTGVTAGGVAVQGAQGMYYQNKGTGRIMCLQPSLQVMEAAGGAYDYASYNFSVAAWYESENLMVFFAPASGAAIAIDYQHPQEAVPFGQVYLWTFASGFVPAAACRDDNGLLVISSQGGVYRTTTNQWVDDNASGTTDTYAMRLTTAELQMSDLQGGFNLKTLQVLFSMRGASSVRITTYPGYASATGYDGRTVATWIALPAPTNSGDPETVMTKPENCMRIQSFRTSIEEMPGVTTQSFEFEGLGVEYSTAGRLLRPTSGRVI